MKKCKCEKCDIEFARAYVRRFCSKKCWHQFNARTIASYNDLRFQWKLATPQERIERMRQRFESFAIKGDGCWGWKGYFNKDGYTMINSGSTGSAFGERYGHRISWILHKGEIPKGKVICHHCDNPQCTNPEHLFIGTTQDNHDDMKAKGRGNIGERHGNSKLTTENVIEIRKMLKQKIIQREIARKFNVDFMVISDIKHNRIWQHVEEEKITEADNLRMKGGLEGSRHKDAKLNEEKVREIKRLLKMGVRQSRIAKDFGVSSTQICYIDSGKNWKHVKLEEA